MNPIDMAECHRCEAASLLCWCGNAWSRWAMRGHGGQCVVTLFVSSFCCISLAVGGTVG